MKAQAGLKDSISNSRIIVLIIMKITNNSQKIYFDLDGNYICGMLGDEYILITLYSVLLL